MPKHNVDYSKLNIYKIKCVDNDCKDIYVGSTTDFNRRKSQHKYSCNNSTDNSHNFKLYKNIRKNGGWDKFKMVIIEKCPCKNSLEADSKEKYWVGKLKASLNTDKPNRTSKESKIKILKNKKS